MGTFPPFPLGILEFNETYRFEKRKSMATTGRIFRLRGAEISELHQVEGRPTKQSLNQGFQRYILLKFA